VATVRKRMQAAQERAAAEQRALVGPASSAGGR